ncbi:MAG: Sec-independent protein translocase subunit TatA/TatB [Nitrospiria bacterium]
MFGVGFPELIVILIIGFVVLGPEKIMAFAKTFGRMAADFKRTAGQIENEVLAELKKVSQEETATPKAPLKKGPDEKNHG